MMKHKVRSLKGSIVLALILCLAIGLGACTTGGGNSTSSDTYYTITFDSNGGSEVDPITVKAGEKAEKPSNPTKAGHTFKGWYLDLDKTEESFIFDETPINSNITLHALWEIRRFDVTFQDESGNVIKEQKDVAWGTLLERPDETEIQKEGYIIKWYTAFGDIWDFATSTVVSQTTLTYRYVTTKDAYNAEDIAFNFYPSYNRGITDSQYSAEFYQDDKVYYTYGGAALQQITYNAELSTEDYSSVTIKMRAVGFEYTTAKDKEDKDVFVPTLDEENKLKLTNTYGTFSQVRAYILTDVGGHTYYNNGEAGYSPEYYYIQSTGTNSALVQKEDEDDSWFKFTFDLSKLKFWQDGKTLLSFAFGYVSSTYGVEIESIVFNKTDKTQQFTVKFQDKDGKQLADSQTVLWNTQATKPETLDDDDVYTYTGEWLDEDGNVFDFSTGIRGDKVLTPQYIINNKYSWSGKEVYKDFFAVYNKTVSNPCTEALHGEYSVFNYFNGGVNGTLRQIVADNLNLTIGNYRYLQLTWRTVNHNGYAYNENGAFGRIRIYVVTDQGGELYKNEAGSESYYRELTEFNYQAVTSPIDMSAKYSDGFYVVTIDLKALDVYAKGTTLKGIAVGTTLSGASSIEVSELKFVTELDNQNNLTVTYQDKDGNAIEGLAAQTVPYGKTIDAPEENLVPESDSEFLYWADESGEEFKFGVALTEDVTLHPVYAQTENLKYSWTGEEIADTFKAIFNTEPNNPKYPAQTFKHNGNVVFNFNNGSNDQTPLKQAVAENLNLPIQDYRYLTVKWRVVDKDGTYVPSGSFALLRIYVLTDKGGNLYKNTLTDASSFYYSMPAASYNYNKTTTPIDISAKFEDGWYLVTIDLNELSYYSQGKILKGFSVGCTTNGAYAFEVSEIKLTEQLENGVTVRFVDENGQTIEGIKDQTIPYGKVPVMPDTSLVPEKEGFVFAGWTYENGAAFDKDRAVTQELTVKASYVQTEIQKYSWSGTEIKDTFKAVYNTSASNPAKTFDHDGNVVFSYDKDDANGNALKQVVAENLNLAKGNYRYLTIKWRCVDKEGNYKAAASFERVRIYILTDQGGNLYQGGTTTEHAKYYYQMEAKSYDYNKMTTPIDISAKFIDGWYTVTVDLSQFPYYDQGTILKGIAIGTTNGDKNAIEVAEIKFLKELDNKTYTVKFVDEQDKPISGISDQTVLYGKAPVLPAVSPAKEGFSFVGWTYADGSEFDPNRAVTEDLTLKAQFSQNWGTYTLKGQEIVENFTASGERYGNKVNDQKTLSLDGSGNAYYNYESLSLPNMAVTTLNAGIHIHEGSKLVIKYKSNKYDTYTVNRLNLNVAFRGQDPATQINSTHGTTNDRTNFYLHNITYKTMSGKSSDEIISFEVASDGTVTATFDLYKMQQDYLRRMGEQEGVDTNYIDAFTFMIVETSSGTAAQTSKATLTFESVEYQNVMISKQND